VPSDRREHTLEQSEKYEKMVWRILSGIPIEVFDEDDGSVWENETWELVKSRSQGDFAGSRAIGSANIVTALNMIHQRLLISTNTSDDAAQTSQRYFVEILDDLCIKKKIRKKPELVRKQFTILKND
tara:strand:+ start:342 stop:722 length:381 start_codon:yes stop_codon:yes gene_type:complete